jgi:hypothetical protein
MAKGKRKKKKPGSSRPVESVDVEGVLQEVEALVPALSGDDAGPVWGQIQRLLAKVKADSSLVGTAVATRDVAMLEKTIESMRNPEVAPPVVHVPDAPLPEIPNDLLREAMRAFRKRLKLTKLDHESKLGRSPLTGGKAADFDSIVAPHEYEDDVCRVLVSRGDLIADGPGFYKLP